jgi:hypothetical protein
MRVSNSASEDDISVPSKPMMSSWPTLDSERDRNFMG